MIPSFGDLCLSELPIDFTGEVKVVGAIGKVDPEGLTICHYFKNYDKNKSEKKYRPKKFINYFNSFTFKNNVHLNKNYISVLEGLVYYARLNGKTLNFLDGIERPYSILNIKKYLRESKNLESFNQIYLTLLHMKEINKSTWEIKCNKLLEFVGLKDIKGDFNIYLEYDSNSSVKEVDKQIEKNRVNHTNNGNRIEIEISTIHSVKGETHAATLILETKFRTFDIKTILEFLLGKPHGNLKATESKFMRQIYVAMTRPKYLVCLAMDKSRISALQQAQARDLGWNLIDLTVD